MTSSKNSSCANSSDSLHNGKYVRSLVRIHMYMHMYIHMYMHIYIYESVHTYVHNLYVHTVKNKFFHFASTSVLFLHSLSYFFCFKFHFILFVQNINQNGNLIVFKSVTNILNSIIRIYDFYGFRANTDFLSGREFWIQSKKKGEGGRLEDYLGTEKLL